MRFGHRFRRCCWQPAGSFRAWFRISGRVMSVLPIMVPPPPPAPPRGLLVFGVGHVAVVVLDAAAEVCQEASAMAWQVLGCDPNGILTEAVTDVDDERLNERLVATVDVRLQQAVLAMGPHNFHWVRVTDGPWAGLLALAAGSNRLKFTRAVRLALTASAYCWSPSEPPQAGSAAFTDFVRYAERAQDESFDWRRRQG